MARVHAPRGRTSNEQKEQSTASRYEMGVSNISYEQSIVYPTIMHDYLSPLTKPLVCGWKRIIDSDTNKLYYMTPNGIRMSCLEQIQSHLIQNNSSNCLTIDQFTFDKNISLHTRPLPKKYHCMNYFINDISKGSENIPIICFNSLDSEVPFDFCYISSFSRLVDNGVTISTDRNFILSCDCTDGCVNSKRCVCRQLTDSERHELVKMGYKTSSGYQNGRLLEQQISGVFECNQYCGCGPQCSNRVVQRGPRHRLAVFRTDNIGWGVMTLDDIPKGSFVCTYNGLVCNDETGDTRGLLNGDEYLIELDYIEMKEGYEEESVLSVSDETDRVRQSLSPDYTPTESVAPTDYFYLVEQSEEQSDSSYTSSRHYYNETNCYIIDAKTHGNIGRFINHCCSPNLFVQNVFIDTHDLRFPWISFFAEKNIKAFSEIHWDYGYIVGSVSEKTLHCLCNAENCRKRLL